uniref:Uncharacterized protein n=1 Tax=Stomoxys calcitrans TaxID=35570 RepID=A0A1I8P906_STOCA
MYPKIATIVEKFLFWIKQIWQYLHKRSATMGMQKKNNERQEEQEYTMQCPYFCPGIPCECNKLVQISSCTDMQKKKNEETEYAVQCPKFCPGIPCDCNKLDRISSSESEEYNTIFETNISNNDHENHEPKRWINNSENLNTDSDFDIFNLHSLYHTPGHSIEGNISYSSTESIVQPPTSESLIPHHGTNTELLKLPSLQLEKLGKHCNSQVLQFIVDKCPTESMSNEKSQKIDNTSAHCIKLEIRVYEMPSIRNENQATYCKIMLPQVTKLDNSNTYFDFDVYNLHSLFKSNSDTNVNVSLCQAPTSKASHHSFKLEIVQMPTPQLGTTDKNFDFSTIKCLFESLSKEGSNKSKDPSLHCKKPGKSKMPSIPEENIENSQAICSGLVVSQDAEIIVISSGDDEDVSVQTKMSDMEAETDSDKKSPKNPKRTVLNTRCNCAKSNKYAKVCIETPTQSESKLTQIPSSSSSIQYYTGSSILTTRQQRQLELHHLRVLVEKKRLELLDIKLKREHDEMRRLQKLFEKEINIMEFELKELSGEKDA